MSQANFSAFERLFDRAVSLVVIAMGAILTGAMVLAGA